MLKNMATTPTLHCPEFRNKKDMVTQQKRQKNTLLSAFEKELGKVMVLILRAQVKSVRL